MKLADRMAVKVALPVKAPVGWHKNHGAVGREIHADLEQEWMIFPHSVETPFLAEGVKDGLEEDIPAFPLCLDFADRVSLANDFPVNHAALVPIAADREQRFDFIPLLTKGGVGRQFAFFLFILAQCPNHTLILPLLDILHVL